MSVPEHDAGLVAALHALDREDPLDDCCLPNVADVDSRPEARHDLRGVEQPGLRWDNGMSSARAALCCARTSRHAALLRRMLDT